MCNHKTALFFIGVFLNIYSWASEEVCLNAEETSKIEEVISIVKKEYITPPTDNLLLDGALKGILGSLDPYSFYLKKDFLKDVMLYTSGSFGGVGLELAAENGVIKVVSTIYKSPAYESCIKPGDILLEVNNKGVHGNSVNEVVDKIRGRPGTKVSLKLIRSEKKESYQVTLRRKKIDIETVKSNLLNNNILHVRLLSFAENTVEKLIESLKKHHKNTKGIVLDVRNNPGGLLDQSVDVSSIFLKKGIVLKTKGRNEEKFFYVNKKIFKNLTTPIVVIVNEGSASGAEIVAAALKDNKRAVVLGKKTFGKGSVQSIIPLKAGGAIGLTTSLYYTPLGKRIDKKGVQPDIEVGSLEGSIEVSDTNKVSDFEKSQTNDRQLSAAINLLKKIFVGEDDR
ncbi:MAG: S41 family peptidase [Rickettsiales bacterium]